MYNYRKIIKKNYQGKAFKNVYKVKFQHNMMLLNIQQNNKNIKLMS